MATPVVSTAGVVVTGMFRLNGSGLAVVPGMTTGPNARPPPSSSTLRLSSGGTCAALMEDGVPLDASSGNTDTTPPAVTAPRLRNEPDHAAGVTSDDCEFVSENESPVCT